MTTAYVEIVVAIVGNVARICYGCTGVAHCWGTASYTNVTYYLCFPYWPDYFVTLAVLSSKFT